MRYIGGEDTQDYTMSAERQLTVSARSERLPPQKQRACRKRTHCFTLPGYPEPPKVPKWVPYPLSQRRVAAQKASAVFEDLKILLVRFDMNDDKRKTYLKRSCPDF